MRRTRDSNAPLVFTEALIVPDRAAELFLDDAASDPIARVARRVRLVVVRFLVNHQGRSALVEQAIWAAVQRDNRAEHGNGGVPIPIHFEIRQIARVGSAGIILAVLLSVWIEVRAGRLEVRPIAFPHAMNVNSVSARRKLRNCHLNLNAVAGCRRDCSRANLLPLCVDDGRVRLLRRLPESSRGEEQRECGDSVSNVYAYFLHDIEWLALLGPVPGILQRFYAVSHLRSAKIAAFIS